MTDPHAIASNCQIGSCQRHGRCMYHPCRNTRPATDAAPLDDREITTSRVDDNKTAFVSNKPDAAPDGLVERLSLHKSWRDSHGELNDAPNQAAARITALDAALAERDATIAGLRGLVERAQLNVRGNYTHWHADAIKFLRTVDGEAG